MGPDYRTCNCYEDAKWAVADSGFLRNKTFLPVTAICGGDTGSIHKEWVTHVIGPLKCYQGESRKVRGRLENGGLIKNSFHINIFMSYSNKITIFS